MIIATAMQKGGSGKTTTAACIAQAAAADGQRVLVVDLDPQTNLTRAIGTAPEDTGTGDSFKLLTGSTPAHQIRQSRTENIDIIPAVVELSTVTSGRGSARRLREALKPIKDRYNVVLIDTPPTAGELQYNAIMAADRLIIPLQTDDYNIQGLHQVAEAAKQIKSSNPDLIISGLLITRYTGKTNLDRELFRDIINEGVRNLELPFLGTIRPGDSVKEAAHIQASLYDYAPKSAPARDYMSIYKYMSETT